MADNPTLQGPPIVAPITTQHLAAGGQAHIDLRQFVTLRAGEQVQFELQQSPDFLTIDSQSGLITGQAPNVELNESFTIMATLTSDVTGEATQSEFELEIIGTILLSTPEAKAYFGGEGISDIKALSGWEIQLFIQQLINEHFVWIYLFDQDKPPQSSGEFITLKKSDAGFNIYHYEHVVMVTPGEKAFAQYGNRRRFLSTMKEVFQQHLNDKNWQAIGINGSDQDNIGRAWVVGRETNSPVNEQAPNDLAEINYLNKKRLQGRMSDIEPKPSP